MATPRYTGPSHPSVTPSVTMSSPVIMLLAWLAVGIPLLWGVIMTLKKALALFA